jgi:hypothetical protein
MPGRDTGGRHPERDKHLQSLDRCSLKEISVFSPMKSVDTLILFYAKEPYSLFQA